MREKRVFINTTVVDRKRLIMRAKMLSQRSIYVKNHR